MDIINFVTFQSQKINFLSVMTITLNCNFTANNRG